MPTPNMAGLPNISKNYLPIQPNDPHVLIPCQGTKPGANKLKVLRADQSKADAFLENTSDRSDRVVNLIRSGLLISRAEKLARDGLWREARDSYLQALRIIVGPDLTLPGTVYQSDTYTGLDVWQRLDALTCLTCLASCASRLNDPVQALQWFAEIDILHKHCYLASAQAHFEWIDYNYLLKDWVFERARALSEAVDLYLSLGNTGQAAYKREFGDLILERMPWELDPQQAAKDLLINNDRSRKLLTLRHPDPQHVAEYDLENLKSEDLQVRGSWRKVPLAKSIPVRMGFASFVWNGHLYIAGGQKESGEVYRDLQAGRLQSPALLRDLWCIDLETLSGWQKLPPYPVPFAELKMFRGYLMAVHNDKAYLFTGRPQVDYFDLVKEEWGSIPTKFRKRDGSPGYMRWPYPGNDITDYTMQMVKGKLYVFGGTHTAAGLGCNMLVALNIETREWTWLSGTLNPTADYSCPGPRKWPVSWVDGNGDRFYLFSGKADRQGAMMKSPPQAHAANDGYEYDDFWSWGITEGQWRRETIKGNGPCPRGEHAATYSPGLGKAIVFGGYNSSVPTALPGVGLAGYTYYADAFLYCHTTGVWKQILTRGFPTYRAQAHVVADPASGRTFLFGGYTNTDYIPSRRTHISRSFGDLWELRIDVDGGHFEGVDLDEEKRTARAGPWQRCFTCGGSGPWKRCSGACNGRAYFCDRHCLSEGWKEHKQMHDCRKIT